MSIFNCIKLFILSSAITLASCNGPDGKPEPTDTPTSGNVKIVVDESYALLFDTQIYTFHSFYKNAHVDVSYLPETEAIKALFNDSCKVIVINRDLTDNEKKGFKDQKIFPKSIKIAEDAVALVVNPSNTDTTITVDKLRSILAGETLKWKDINPSSSLGDIQVVFDNPGSANARYMKDTLLGGKDLGKNSSAVKSNKEVIEYVSKNENALGIISVNWISDRDDTLSQSFLKKIKVVGVAKNEGSKAYKPYQAFISTKDYPFTRSVYMISRQTRAGLGMGFVAFVAGEKGQRIILKSGLLPATMPVRVIQIRK